MPPSCFIENANHLSYCIINIAAMRLDTFSSALYEDGQNTVLTFVGASSLLVKEPPYRSVWKI